ncbi:hypothetical protein [Paenibacillus sonchi]|uniref:hypothetical protein n=1 Tax=Paenibacillus sonchi TaxID=373687 RepID=UPI001F46F0D6|nr:hypothetical protein [Paenibacillus sonchi]
MRGKSTSDLVTNGLLDEMRGKSTSDSAVNGLLEETTAEMPLLGTPRPKQGKQRQKCRC